MCGIAGIIGRISDANCAALSRIERALVHRGPDSQGIWVGRPDEAGNGCLLAHRRLSILDLSTSAHQPMIDPASGQTIVFNGEIYNYVALRDELQEAGHHFESTGDTAVMLRLLSTQGCQAVEKLRGMFAFGLWDDQNRELVVARDPLGIKPLYICQNPDPAGEWSLVFASEVRAILASQLIGKPRLNPDAAASMVWNGFVSGPFTIVKGIESLNPGEVRLYDRTGQLKVKHTFWSLQSNGRQREFETEQTLCEAVRESVRLHLASDVPLGIFLSGGIDSSAVAHLAQQVNEAPIHTFTLAFDEEDMSEGATARTIAAAIGTEHREILLTETMFVDNLGRALETLDQPTFDGLNAFYIAKAVREAGLTVALVGTGGDELFGGYTSFRRLPQILEWNRRVRFLPHGVKIAAAQAIAYAMAGGGGAVAPQTRWAKLPDIVRSGDFAIDLYQLAYALFLPKFQNELMTDELLENSLINGLPPSMYQQLGREIGCERSVLSAIGVLEQRCFLGERLLRDTDAASMAVSLEVRLPFVDQVIVDIVNRLPDEQRFQPVGRKQLLRKIGLNGLDPALFERPKRGFVLPYDQWMRRRLGTQINDTMCDSQLARAVGLNSQSVSRLWEGYRNGQRGLHWSRVWALYVLIQWCHRYGVLL